MKRDIYITSGCSYSDPDFKHIDPNYTVEYDMWMAHLRKKLGIKEDKWFDLGKGGACNRWIFNSIIRKCTEVGESNVKAIFVSWSGFDRYTIPCTEIKTNLTYELLNWSEITSGKSITSMFQVYKSYFVQDEDYDKQYKLLQKIKNLDDVDNIDNFLMFKKEVMKKTWEDMGMNFAASAKRMFTDHGLDIMFSDNLGYMYALFQYAKSIGAQIIAAQGVFPISVWELNRLVQMGFIQRLRINKGWNSELSKLLLTNFENKPRKISYILDKEKKHFIGWPFYRHLGGDTFCDLITEKELLISELDGHPNKEGNELIGNIFYERYKDVYTLA